MTESAAYNYCALPLAPYACRPDQSQGRLIPESDSQYRTPFQRDRDRIIHCSAFRRLKYKTQVFVYHEGDHYRTRLSHTLEVSQISRTLARALMVNEDLAEAVALAHDLGHTPFAHIGEEYLKQCMEPWGGFEHNDQSLRVLTLLEDKYPLWPGLNLSWETLEGVVKHNGPIIGPGEDWKTADLAVSVRALQARMDLRLSTYASVEAQVAALADDIAYNNHDVEDGIRAGFFGLDDLARVPLLNDVIGRVRTEYPDIGQPVLVHEIIREMIGEMVDDVMRESQKRLRDLKPGEPDDIRAASAPVIAFSPAMYDQVQELRAFLFENMYRHYTINRIWVKVERIITELFAAFMKNYRLLPDGWQRRVENAGGPLDEHAQARIICDYIAGMTDRYAIREHERIFDLYWDLR